MNQKPILMKLIDIVYFLTSLQNWSWLPTASVDLCVQRVM